VEAALSLLLEMGSLPSFDSVRTLVRDPTPPAVPQVSTPVLDLSGYDMLLRCAHG
jgi:hypothetical protein